MGVIKLTEHTKYMNFTNQILHYYKNKKTIAHKETLRNETITETIKKNKT